MMTLEDVKDWLRTQISADTWKIGTYDISKDKTVYVRNLTSNRNVLTVDDLQNATTVVKGISIVVHWSKNPDETERVAQSIHALFYGQQPAIGGYRIAKCDMRSNEPIGVGADTNGIYEYAIETWLAYERKEQFMTKVTIGAYPVFDIVFSIGTKGFASSEDDVAFIRDMGSSLLSVESNVEKWNPMDQEGQGRVLATAKAATMSLKSKRSVGDKGNNCVYTILRGDGLGCSTKYSIEFPDGSSITGNCVLDVRVTPSGDSISVIVLRLDITFDRESTFIPAPAIPERGA